MRPAVRKVSDHVTTPPGTPNSVQGVAVLGCSNGDATAHPVLTWVTR